VVGGEWGGRCTAARECLLFENQEWLGGLRSWEGQSVFGPSLGSGLQVPRSRLVKRGVRSNWNLSNPSKKLKSLCWGLVQITKNLCAMQPRFPKDLSISNAVTVKEFQTRTLVDRNTGIMLLHKCCYHRCHSRPQGHEELGATTLASHERHLRVLTHIWRPWWLPEPRFQPRCGSRGFGTGI
jgi:hypothetical protein